MTQKSGKKDRFPHFRHDNSRFSLTKQEVTKWSKFQPGSTSLSSQHPSGEAHRHTVAMDAAELVVRSHPIVDTAAVAPAKRQGTESREIPEVPLQIQRMLDISREWDMLEYLPPPPAFFFDEPKFPAVGAKLKEPWNDNTDNVGAFDLDWEKAYTRTLGEAIERSCQLHPRHRMNEMIKGSYEDIEENAYDPVPFFPFSDSMKFDNSIREMQFSWFPVKAYHSGEENLLPMQLSFLYGAEEHDILDSIRTTNGTAMWSDEKGAIFRGLCELIERDAFFIHYLGKVTPPRIERASFGDEIQNMIEYIERYHLKVHVFDISLEFGIPVVLCIIIDRTGIGPAISLGSNCSPLVKEAVKGAILEAIQIRRYNRIMKLEYESGTEMSGIGNRVLDWYDLENIQKIDFILESNHISKFADLKDTEKEFLDRFPYKIYISDVTLPNLGDYKVVKVNVPELLPLYFFDDHKPISNNRVQGYLGNRVINDMLHPFL